MEPTDLGHPPGPSGISSGGLSGARLADVLNRAARGDEPAWNELVHAYARRVFALARSRLGDHDSAEEVTQAVFVTVASKLGTGGYAEQGKFEPWLFRVAMNRVRDEVRRRRRGGPESLSSGPELPLAPRGAEPEAGQTALRTALSSLSDADREIIELRHHAGLSFARIAELLGEPAGTLLARHHRALRKLRAILETPSPREPEPARGERSDD